MIDFTTVVLIVSILIWPVAFIAALIVKLFRVKKMSKEMYPGVSFDDGTQRDENGILQENTQQ